MIKAIVFDCYGVLIGNGFWDTYTAAGGDPEKDSEFIGAMIYQKSLGQISTKEFNRHIANQLMIPLPEFEKILSEQEGVNVALLRYIRDELKPKFKIGMLSNASAGVIERYIQPDDMKIFDSSVISGDVGLLKPDPRVFQLIADKLDVKLNEMLFIDDSQDYVDAAKQIDITSIRYKNLQQLMREMTRHNAQ